MEEVWMCKTSVLWAITYGLYGYICIRPPHLRPIMPLQGQIFSIWPLARVCLRIQLCYLFLSTNSSLGHASFLFVHFTQFYEKNCFPGFYVLWPPWTFSLSCLSTSQLNTDAEHDIDTQKKTAKYATGLEKLNFTKHKRALCWEEEEEGVCM